MTEKDLLEFIEYLENSHAITVDWKKSALKRLVKEYVVEQPLALDYSPVDDYIMEQGGVVNLVKPESSRSISSFTGGSQ